MIYAGTLPSGLETAVLLLIGFCVGTAGSFFGVGGAFLVTPALNILGYPMIYAIGTDLAHMMGKSVIATIRHSKLGNVDWKAGAFLLIGTFPGVKLGAITVMELEKRGNVESVVRIVYILLLSIIGSLILRESLKEQDDDSSLQQRAIFQKYFQIKPIISLKASGIKQISIWSIIIIGIFTGFLSSFLGVGGGFIRMPALIYFLGIPTKIAIGTDLLEVCISGGYGAFLYAKEGHVDVIAALIMLLAASVGSQLGALATVYVDSHKIRFYLAITVLGTALAVSAKQMGLVGISAGILLILGPSLAGIIIFKLISGIRLKNLEKSIINKGNSE